MRSALRLAIAEPEHGPEIARLIGADHLELDWSNLGGQWVVVMRGERIAACAQVLPGRPIGQIEHMGLAEDLTPRERAEAVSMVISQCSMLLTMAGCGVVMTTVPDDLPGYKRVLERRGAVAFRKGDVMMKRLG